MSYVLPEAISLEAMIDYATGVVAGVKAEPALAAQAPAWEERRQGLRRARDERDRARELVLEASAVVRVADATWDRAVLDLSGRAYLAAGKDEKAPPYAPLFGRIKAREALSFGPAKASGYGKTLLQRGRELAHPDLAGALTGFERAGAALEDAGQKRAAAQQELSVHEVRRARLREELLLQIAMTEIAILQAHPGRRELVRAVLAPPRAARSAAREPEDDVGPEPPPAPGTPDDDPGGTPGPTPPV